MRDKILCAFPLEVKARDLDARLYLALKFASKGFHTIIGFKSGVHEFIFNSEIKFIYFDKGINTSAAGFCEKIIQNGGVIYSLDEEGGVYSPVAASMVGKMRNNDAVMQYRSKVFAWGEENKKRILNHSEKINAKDIVVTGHPRFDLCKPKWAKMHRKIGIDICSDINENVILINTSFGVGNGYLNEKSLNKMIKSMYPDSKIDGLKNIFEYHASLYPYFIKLIKSVAKAFPSQQIIVRPHPVEDEGTYQTEFKGINNVLVTKSGSVKEWIVRSIIVIHHDCTTAIEAYLFGKEIISYCPIIDRNLAQTLPIEISDICRDEKSVINLISRRNSGETFSLDNITRNKRTNLIKPIIDNVDGNASEKIVNAVTMSLPNLEFKREACAHKTQGKNCLGYFINILVELRRRTKTIFRQKDASIERALKKVKFDGLTIEEIRVRTRLFMATDKTLAQVKVEQVGNQAYKISRIENGSIENN